MGEEIKAKFNFVEREPSKALFTLKENEPAKAIFKIAPPSLNYDLLFNKPQVNSVELVGNKSLEDLGITTEIAAEIAEHNSSQQAHPHIQGLITAEATTRANADTVLQANINTETANRIQGDLDEATARASADSTLQTNITTEASTRASADNTLQANIETETANRISADNAIQTDLETESSTRATADINLQTNITNEAATRASEDTSIRNSIKDGKLYIQKNGSTIATFSANQSGDTTANIIADSPTWGNITGTLSDQADLQSALNSKQPNLTSANAGTGISITGSGSNVIISNTQTSAEWGNITGTLSDQTDLQSALDNKVTKNNIITGATKTKITYDSKGLVTSGTDLTESDIPNLHLSKISDITASAQEVNYLTNTTSNIQGQINSKLNITDVINNITTTTTNQALSANMGKELQDQINNLKQRGRYLSVWDCTLGKAQTTPTVNPYTYKAGDYFLVGVVASQGGTNYRPNGATYDKDIPSTTVETGAVVVNDAYYYDGTSWTLLHTEQPTVAFSTLAGSPEDNFALRTALNSKISANNPVDPSTKCKITYDSKGLVTGGSDLAASDIPNLTLNKITDVTASANELNILDGATLTTTELNYVDGVTSSIQTQLNSKATPSDIKDGVLTIQKNGTNVATFSANQSSAQTANIIVPTAADDISYTNPDYPTVGAALDKLLYVMPSVSISGGGNYEIGATVNTVNLSWTWNKNISSQSLNQGIGSLATNVRSYSYTTPTTSNKTFTITGSDGTNTKSASTSITFYYKRYWGVSANTTLTDAEILALSQELSGNRAQTRTFNCSGGKYFYFVILASYCSGISFKVGGLSFSDVNVVTRNITNAQGHTASYNIYRPNNIQTGSAINVVVS